MRATLLSIFLAVSFNSFVRADDFQMTGPEVEKIKKEIIAIDQEELRAMQKAGAAAADFFDKYEVDSLLFLGGLNENTNKEGVVREWRSGVRTPIGNSATHHDYRVKVYDNGNVAILDYLGDMGPEWKYKGKPQPLKGHIQEVFIKHNGVWRIVVQDRFQVPGSEAKTAKK